MLIDELKARSIQALKDKDNVTRGILSVVITKYQLFEVEQRSQGKEVGDKDVLQIIQKTLKELSDEKAGYVKVNNLDRVKNIEQQEEVLTNYLPKQLNEKEIRDIINSLEDKSTPSVMKYFKANYPGQVDLSLVNTIIRSL